MAERSKIQERRRRLLLRIIAFNKKADHFLGDLDLDDVLLVENEWQDYESDEEVIHSDNEDVLSSDDDEDSNDDEDEAKWAEDHTLVMPSRLGAKECHRLGLGNLMTQEIKLREGQANDALEELRTALAEKSLLFRTKIRGHPSQKMSTRSWSGIKRANGRIRKHVRKYNLARAALISMEADIPQFKPMTSEDLRMSADITEENRFGQRRDILAWFWRMGPQRDDEEGSWMDECEFVFCNFMSFSHGYIFYFTSLSC